MGDDVIIFSHDLAEEYRRLCGVYGLVISMSKSLTPKGIPKRTLSEFLSRQYFNGKEISRLPTALLMEKEASLFMMELVVRSFHRCCSQTSDLWSRERSFLHTQFDGLLSGDELKSVIRNVMIYLHFQVTCEESAL